LDIRICYQFTIEKHKAKLLFRPYGGVGINSTAFSDKGYGALNNIHNNSWALYAGVEFGNKEYVRVSDSVQFIASSTKEGGSVEVWLDSIGTGNKIATCTIGNTGSSTSFKAFSAKTKPTTGRHDVYLRFLGKENEALFQLEWIQFISKKGTKYAIFD
jgi:hypothetical protein